MSVQTKPFVLSLDIGTSSVRSRVYTSAGDAVENLGLQIQYSMTRTSDGGEFIDVESLCELVFQTIDHALKGCNDAGISISAVSSCTFWHNVVGLDSNGKPCTPLLNWSDTRPEKVLAQLRERLEPQAFTIRTGCPFHASYLPAKITWLKETMPGEFSRVRYWMSFGEYLYFKITGERRCSYSMASACGLLNSANLCWDEETLQHIPASVDQLSPLCDVNQAASGLQSDFQLRWQALKDAAWYPAVGDGAASNVGCGCVSTDRYALMVGTSGAMRVIWKGGYKAPPGGLWCYRIDRNRPVQGGALSNGGNLVEWMKNTFVLPSWEELESQLRLLEPDGHGLTFMPFLSGQRSPRWNPHMRGTVHGLHVTTQPAQIFQAGLEAIAFRFKLIHDLIAANFGGEHIVTATGGGLLRSPAWVQIMANVLGHPVHISHVAEASCRGAALLALESLGVLDDVADADPMFGEVFTPNPEAHEVYQKALQRHVDYELS